MVYRRYRPRVITQTDKHEITWSFLGQNASTNQAVTLLDVVQPADKNSATEVAIGSEVRGIYIEFNMSAEAASTTIVFHWTVQIFRDGQTPSASNVYYQADRSQIMKRGMEMIPKDVSTVIKRIIFVPIPRGQIRMKANSAVQFKYITSGTSTINLCGFAIYKEKS